MLHVIFLLIAASHMLTKAADVALKPPLMISWRDVSAEHKLHPQEEDNKETLFLRCIILSPLSPKVLDPHQQLIGSIMSVSHPPTKFAKVHPGVFV